jgi:hypothetical protein
MFKTISKNNYKNSLSMLSDTLGSAVMPLKKNNYLNKSTLFRSGGADTVGQDISEITINEKQNNDTLATTDVILDNSNKLSDTSVTSEVIVDNKNNPSTTSDASVGNINNLSATSDVSDNCSEKIINLDILTPDNIMDFYNCFTFQDNNGDTIAHRLAKKINSTGCGLYKKILAKIIDICISRNEIKLFEILNNDNKNLLFLLVENNCPELAGKTDVGIRTPDAEGNIVVTDTEVSEVIKGGNSEISIKLKNKNNFMYGGSELSDIIKSIELRGGKKSKSKKITSGTRKLKMKSDNSESSIMHNSKSSKSSKSSNSSKGNALSRMISNKKSQLHDKFLTKIKSMLSDKLISLNDKVISDDDDNAEIIKRFLYGKISADNSQLSGFDKITMLNKMSDDEILDMLKKIKDFKELIKLNKEIKEKRQEKSMNTSSDSEKKSSKTSNMSSSDRDSTIGDITGIKEKKSKKVVKKISKSKSKK